MKSTIFFVTILLLCSAGVYSINNETEKKDRGIIGCDFCKTVIGLTSYEIHHYNKTIVDVEHIVEDLCKDIGGTIVAEECDFIINHLQSVFDWIASGLNPSEICKKMHMCKN